MTSASGRRLPRALGREARVAIVAPSWGGIGHLRDRTERALEAMRRLGATPILMPHAASATDGLRPWVSADARERVADLHAAFADPDIDAILCAIGGNHSAQMLPWLDMDLIARAPKLLCGYSDATVLLHAIHHDTDLVCLYGPALLPQLGEIGGPDPEVITHLCALVRNSVPMPYDVPDCSWQADEPRIQSDAAGRRRHKRPAEPRRALRTGRAVGPLMPACLPSLRHLLGTRWQPRLSGALLMLEAPGEDYDVRRADADLTHLSNAGILSQIGALLLGRSEGWSADDVGRFDRVALEMTEDTGIPVLAGIACSHASPTLALPIGTLAEVDGLRLRLLEPVVAGAVSGG